MRDCLDTMQYLVLILTQRSGTLKHVYLNFSKTTDNYLQTHTHTHALSPHLISTNLNLKIVL